MTTRLLVCRARFSRYCQHGEPVDRIYDSPLYEEDDGTWDPRSLSVVCNTCYVELMPYSRSGQLLLEEIEGAIAAARKEAQAEQPPPVARKEAQAEQPPPVERSNPAGWWERARSWLKR